MVSCNQELRFSAINIICTISISELPGISLDLIYTFDLLDHMKRSLHVENSQRNAAF